MKISIITVVYNNESHIAECIESLQKQTYKDIEHIIIDGGSTDGTIEILKNKGVSFISEKDNGVYDALNKGISMSTGEIVGILHSDDLYPNAYVLEKIANTFKQNEIDLVHGNGKYVKRNNPEKIQRIYNSKPFKKHYLNWGWIPLHTTIYLKKEAYSNYGLYNEKYSIASDYEASLRWFTNSQIKTYYLDETTVLMRLGGLSTSWSMQYKKSYQDIHIIHQFKLLGLITFVCKICRKIPQYLILNQK